MSHLDVIAEANDRLASDEGDPHWQAIIEVGLYVEEEPAAVWRFAQKWAISPNDDIRMAIATCLLEHLLEQHFELIFPCVKRAVEKSDLFADTFSHCWVSVPASSADKAEQFAALQAECRGRVHD